MANISSSILENEYYSTVRPKQLIQPCEKPTLALKRRGVRYVEIRSLDLDLFNPIGINASRARFIEALLLSCLIQESPKINAVDFSTHNANQLTVAHEGRKPGVSLIKDQKIVRLKDWANEILDNMQAICDILDDDNTDNLYNQALQEQRKLIEDPELSPSARILAQMRETKQPFACFANNISRTHAENFTTQSLSTSETLKFTQMAAESHSKQSEIENNDKLEFDEFLNKYFKQT